MKFELHWGGLHKIISGGQTGADQGGIMAAWRRGVETGGQAALGYKTQGGHNPILEVLELTQASSYSGRTKTNVASSDGTVIIAHHMSSPGTELTRREARLLNKPLLELNIIAIVQAAIRGQSVDNEEIVLEEIIGHASALCDFIISNQIQILNVAGNREVRSEGLRQGDLIVTKTTEMIVGMAIDVLAADGKIVTKKDKVDF